MVTEAVAKVDVGVEDEATTACGGRGMILRSPIGGLRVTIGTGGFVVVAELVVAVVAGFLIMVEARISSCGTNKCD